MHKICLKKIKIENFKGFKEAEFDFYDYTKVSGANGLGKSTLAAAYMWLFWNTTTFPAIRMSAGNSTASR